MSKRSTIELSNQDLKFSSGHFTIFSATEREALHGHTYIVTVSISTDVQDDGLNFDYRYYRDTIKALCEQLNLRFLLPTESRYLKLEEENDFVMAHFGNEKIPFLKKDVTLLPLSNITLEELSHWFLKHLCEDENSLKQHFINEIVVKISSSPGRAGYAKESRIP